jgi:hypothetical protein
LLEVVIATPYRFLTRLDRSRDAFYFTFWITEAELLAMFESP